MQEQQKRKDNTNRLFNEADQIEITYFTDPLCCWSWGMEPQWRKLLYEFDGRIRARYCMGGLLPAWDNFNDPVNHVTKPIQMGPVWMEAGTLSGMPVKTTIWFEDPPQSSYLPCIAVKCAGFQSKNAEEKLLRRLREAVMTEGINIALLTAILSIARNLLDSYPGLLDVKQLEEDIRSERGIEAFRTDLEETRLKDITRFPTLLFRREGHQSLILSGYRPYSILSALIFKICPGIAKTNQTPDIEGFQKFWGNVTSREIMEAGSIQTV